jgi:hypothetical protein
MQEKFYVSHDGQQLGPFAPSEIIKMVQDGSLAPLDYLYDESKTDWVLFLEHTAVSHSIKELKPKAPPKVQVAETTPETHLSKIKLATATGSSYLNYEWFCLKGENKFGPFAYTDLVKMLQQGVVFEFDYAWHSGMHTWQRIAELEAFSKDNIRALKSSSMPEINEIFFRRRHRRVKYGGTILIHDNKKVWRGQAVEISEGGAGIVMENSLVVPGQQLYLHFKPGDGVPPFNAMCEVVSKSYVNGVKDAHASVKYGLKFVTVNSETQKFLHDFTKSGVAA